MRTPPSYPTRFLLALALAFAAPVAGCGAIGFDVEQNIPQQTVPGSTPILGGLLPDFLNAPVPINVDLTTETAKRNTGPASHVYLSELSLAATPHDKPAGNFDFLDEVHIYVEAQQARNLPRVEIAHSAPVPKSQTTVKFDIVPNVDLLPYVKQQDGDTTRAKITAEAKGTQPKMDFTYDGKIVLTIKI